MKKMFLRCEHVVEEGKYMRTAKGRHVKGRLFGAIYKRK